MIFVTASIRSLFGNIAGKCTPKVIAVDIGSSHIKLLLAERLFGRIEVKSHRIIDLQEEGLLSAEEVNRHLRDSIVQMGDESTALVLPQHLSLAHIIDLPKAGKRDTRAMIQRDTINFSGLSEASIVSDSRQLRPFGKVRNPHWVGIAKEQEIQKLMDRLGLEEDRSPVCDIVSAGASLAAAFLNLEPSAERVVLADLGTTGTLVAVIDQGQCIYTSSYPIGSESFTSAIASLQRCSFEEAEAIKRAMNLFTGPDVQPGFLPVVNAWLQDLVKLLREWESTNPEIHLLNPPCRIHLSGGGICQPGLMEYLKTKRGLNISAWPRSAGPEEGFPLVRHAIAWGAVLKSFGKAPAACSLLPLEMRQRNHRAAMLMEVNWFCMIASVVLLLLLASGSAHKLYLSRAKAAMAADVENALRKAEAIESLVDQREQAYGRFLPLVESQKKSMDMLSTVQQMQQIREGKDLWFLLLADLSSYARGSAQPDTNGAPAPAPNKSTGQPAQGDSLVLELAISGQTDEQRRAVLREVVGSMNKQPIYQKVDEFLPSQRNTNLLDPRAVLPDRHYSLLLDTAPLPVPQPPRMAPAKKTDTAPAGSKGKP